MVDAIVEAAAATLREEGLDATTTNRVAERAGVSVGSLYQYFPNKLALVRALVERHDAEMWHVFVQQAATAFGEPFAIAIPRVIDALFEAHRVDPALHRVLHQQAAHVGGDVAIAETMTRSRAVLEELLRARADQHALADEIPIAARVVVEAVEALIHASIDVTPDEARALQRHAARLVLAYLGCAPVVTRG